MRKRFTLNKQPGKKTLSIRIKNTNVNFFSFGPGTWAINPYLGVKLRPFQKFLAGGMGCHNELKYFLNLHSQCGVFRTRVNWE